MDLSEWIIKYVGSQKFALSIWLLTRTHNQPLQFQFELPSASSQSMQWGQTSIRLQAFHYLLLPSSPCPRQQSRIYLSSWPKILKHSSKVNGGAGTSPLSKYAFLQILWSLTIVTNNAESFCLPDPNTPAQQLSKLEYCYQLIRVATQ